MIRFEAVSDRFFGVTNSPIFSMLLVLMIGLLAGDEPFLLDGLVWIVEMGVGLDSVLTFPRVESTRVD